jgi:DNA polymerase-3 subunit beta
MLSIVGEHSSYQLPVLPLEEFPTLPEFRDGEKIVVNGEEIKEAIRQTIYATLAEDPRPFLSSVLWEIESGRLRIVATDVNRLAIRDLAIQGGASANALLPVRSLREIGNVFGGDAEETLEITLSDKLIFIHSEGVLFSSRLVEAQFPRYEQVVPKEFVGTAIVSRNQLVEALERTALVSYSVRVHFSEKGMFITAKEPEKGKSYEELITEFSGKEIEIGFNVRFLLDFLKVSASERVVFKYLQEQKPVLIQGIEAESYIYVVMPLKLQG